MGKVKEKMLMEEYDQAFPEMQTAPFVDGVWPGLVNTTFPLKSLFEQDGNGLNNGNNSSSPSMTKKESSAVSKPETLIFNAQAKRNTTTKEKKAKTGQYINVTDIQAKVEIAAALQKMQDYYAQPKFKNLVLF